MDALSVDTRTGAVIVDEETCTSCGNCIDACPGKVPYLHPENDKVVICDLCGGDPECVKVCTEAGYCALRLVEEDVGVQKKLHALEPDVVARDLAVNLYGEKGEEVI